MAGLGVYVGNDAVSVENFENWLGTPVDFLAAHTGQANWSDWNSSISWLAKQFKDVPATLTWSIPMFADGGTLAAGAKGDYNSNYLTAAKTLASTYAGDDKIYVRVGEEFNGTWMTWAAAGKEADFIATYRNIVDAFRSVSDKFVFEWNVNVGDYGMNPADAYPGDNYVDIVGMDFYYNTDWDSKDPLQAWNHMVSRTYGLQWLEDFAKAHGKPTAYSEWGVNSDTAGPYIQKAKEWFESHNVVYQQYWDSNSAFAGLLNGGAYPTAAAAFQDVFGPAASVPDSSTPPAETPLTYSVVNGVHTLLAGVADLSLAAIEGVNLAGNALANVLTGNDADNLIDGKAGADKMIGGKGNDIYVVDNAGDVVVESAGEGTDTVRASVSYTLAANVENLELLTGALTGTGNGLANTITGNAADNVIDGKAGADRMIGGLGNDIYYVDNTGDVVVENAGEGTDTVRASVNYVLTANVENLELLTGALTGTGNDLANTITGNAADNLLYGLAGADILFGGAGNDTLDGGVGVDKMVGGLGNDLYYVDNVGDLVVENVGEGADTVRASVNYVLTANVENLELLTGALNGTGNDLANTITGNAADNVLYGLAGADVLSGGAGNDTLDGGVGVDKMVGGLGNDLYYVDNVGDVVVENANEGIDTVRATVTHTLAANVENLEMLTGAIAGYGNDLANTITGNAADNIIDGRAGADKMIGGLGNDIYYVDNGGDSVVEAAGGGVDTVRSGITYTLGANVENLELLWAGSSWGTGNELDNVITGNAGANTLSGLAGNDTLIGGAGVDTLIGGAGADILSGGEGSDTFVFNSVSDSVLGKADLITDLTNDDYIDLRQIDASTKIAGDQAFHMVTAFTGAAAEALLQYDANQNRTILSLDINGDKAADSVIYMTGNHLDFGHWLW
jgi:Ca2+-binding RTX toxin-like protein